MKRNYLLFSLFFILCNLSFAQTVQTFSCGAVPSEESIAFLNEVRQQRTEYQNSGGAAEMTKIVKIKIHIIRDTDGSNGIAASAVQSRIANANVRLAGANVELEVCGAYNYIDNSTYSTFDYLTDETIRADHDLSGAINIYFAKAVVSGSSSFCGYAKFPTASTALTGTSFTVVDNDCHESTFIHELGHCFGLYHTHETAFGAELVNGSNCSTAGDQICDTEADPQLSTSTVNTSCVYTGSATDANGDTYVPNPNNIMSYSRKSCRTFFSAGQNSNISASANSDFELSSCGNECTTTINTFPYTQGFEGASLPTGWKQDGADDQDWDRNSGGTTSSSTGPSSAAEGSWYMYTETTGNGTGYPNKTFSLLTPCFNLQGQSTATLTFQYHMYGATMGSLEVQASTDGGNSWSGNLWSRSGDQGNQWSQATVNLNAWVSASNLRLRFLGTSSTSYTSDMAIDDVELSVTGGGGQQYANLPYSTGFESGGFDQYWTTQSSNSFGRIQVTSANSPSGSYHATMDVTTNNNFAQNEMRLGLRLAGASNVQLSFDWKEFSDEDHTQDGVYLSDDGGSSFTKVYNLTGGSTTYQTIDLDISALAAANSLSLNNTFVVKFQQYDNYTITTDGHAIDNVSVVEGASCPALDFDAYTISPYGNGQDGGTATASGNTLTLNNNAWKYISFPYTVTANTVLEVEFSSTTEGEIHGIGFDTDLGISSNLTFQFHGTQSWGLSNYNDYTTSSGYKSYTIPVGNFYTGSYNYLFFVADKDGSPQTNNASFRNVRVYEGSCGADAPAEAEHSAEAATLPQDGISAWPNPFSGSIQVEVPASLGEIESLRVYNMMGEIVYEQTDLPASRVATLGKDLARGMYMVRVKTQDLTDEVKIVKLQ